MWSKVDEYREGIMRIAGVDINTDPQTVVPQGASVAALAGVIAGYLPIVVALVPAIYYAILIFESKTVQKWFRRRRIRKATKRRARMERRRAKLSRV